MLFVLLLFIFRTLIPFQSILGIVQYNNDNRAFEGGAPPPNIELVCSIMTSGGALSQYAAINTYDTVSWRVFQQLLTLTHSLTLNQYGMPCLDVSYQTMIEEMQNTTWGGPSDGARQVSA